MREQDRDTEPNTPNEGDIMAGDRRIARADTALPDWYASDTAYRPIPIVWFAGALILQVIAQPAIVFVARNMLGLPAIITFAIAVLATCGIGFATWRRGMARAAKGWRIATLTMLAFFLIFTALGLSI